MGILVRIFRSIFCFGSRSNHKQSAHIPYLRYSNSAPRKFDHPTSVHQCASTGFSFYTDPPHSAPSGPCSGTSTHTTPEQASYLNQNGGTVSISRPPSISSSLYSREYYDDKSCRASTDFDQQSLGTGSTYISPAQERAIRRHGWVRRQSQTPSLSSSVYSRAYDDQTSWLTKLEIDFSA
jgi:hypothetical protein